MASAWEKLEISAPDFKAADFTDAIDKIKEFISLLVNLLELILTFIQAIADPLAAAIRTIIEKLKEYLESFLEGLGVYGIYIPIQKRLVLNFMDLGDVTPSLATKLGIFAQADEGNQPIDPAMSKFVDNMNRYKGGNAGFAAALVGSLYDDGDICRPQFVSEDDYMAGVTMVMGTNVDALGFLDDIWKLLGLFGNIFSDSGGAGRLPTPTGLTATPMMNTYGGNAPRGQSIVDVFLKWDAAAFTTVKDPDLNVVFAPDEVAIIRVKNNVNALSSTSATELIGTEELREGVISGGGDAEVISVKPYKQLETTYIDSNLGDVYPDDSFYYAVAWKLRGWNEGEEFTEGGGTELARWRVSNVARVTPSPTLPKPTPPNWYRTPSVASMFPALARLLRLILANLDRILSKFLSAADILSAYIDFLKAEIRKYERIIQKILDLLKEITLTFDMPTAGIYYRTWDGKGGNQFFVNDTLLSLTNGYPNAPPFHQGDEYVTGLVLLAGGPAPSVAAFKASISLFFGNMDEDLQHLLELMEDQVDQIEQVFGDDMTPDFDVVEDNFSDNFESVIVCEPTEEREVSFGDDFKVE